MSALPEDFKSVIGRPGPLLALAPMQDITDLPFWRLLMRYGGPDVFYTEYFRVHAVSRLEKELLRWIVENDTGRPVIAQVAGEDVPSLARTARELQRYPVAAIDLNLGCPAPIVCRKKVGGALLRDLPKIDQILGAMREAITIPFTVKTRLGFGSTEGFETLLALFAKHHVDLVAVHGRTVQDGYLGRVDYERIAQAAQTLPCPVLINGDIHSAAQAVNLWRSTGARGLMIGRGAIRNPWLFAQIRQQYHGQTVSLPSGRDGLVYLRALFAATRPAGMREVTHVEKMKKYLNFIGVGIEPSGQFLHQIRRVTTEADFVRVCEAFLDHDRPMPLEPFHTLPKSPEPTS